MPFTLTNIKEDLEDLGSRFDGAPDLEFRAATQALGKSSAPGRTRTSDIRLRRSALYPAELRAQGRTAARFESSERAADRPRGRRGRDSNPRWGLNPILA